MTYLINYPTTLRGFLALTLVVLAILFFVYTSSTLAFLLAMAGLALAAYALYIAAFRIDRRLRHGAQSRGNR
jgi:uncharacterized membrane protein